ncbi:MAG: peptidase [Ignavibacteriae bacterium]|nr:MAG: peptidase [Ignavibacteriota bacterium]
MKTKIFLLLLILVSNIFAQEKVYVVTIEGMIDLGLAPYVKRITEEAVGNSAEVVIFKINTFGGRVDAATQIKDAIIDCPIPTVAFINKRAISAGALISLSCDKIIMVPGASIGATTVVDQTGGKQSEKAQSYMRAEMRSTAERMGRRTDIAEGMVDETVIVEGLVDSTKLITLTSEEAIKLGMADSVISDFSGLLNYLKVNEADIVDSESNWAEDFIRFLNNPIITSILMMVILVGMFTEIKTPGWGLPGTAALIALALFFGTGYILELASIIEIVLFIVGVILLILEIFVIPGFGIFGIAGILLIVGSLFLGLISDFPLVDGEIIEMAIIQLAGAFILTGIIIYFLLKFLPKTSIWNKLILNRNIDEQSGYTSDVKLKALLNQEGLALTDLRPSGTAKIKNERIDVVTNGEYITKGKKVRVIKEEGSKIVVEEIEK